LNAEAEQIGDESERHPGLTIHPCTGKCEALVHDIGGESEQFRMRDIFSGWRHGKLKSKRTTDDMARLQTNVACGRVLVLEFTQNRECLVCCVVG
jgi:hypothetical protein